MGGVWFRLPALHTPGCSRLFAASCGYGQYYTFTLYRLPAIPNRLPLPAPFTLFLRCYVAVALIRVVTFYTQVPSVTWLDARFGFWNLHHTLQLHTFGFGWLFVTVVLCVIWLFMTLSYYDLHTFIYTQLCLSLR